ncbi:unnamed protein product, partial [Rotaria socialis]
VEKLEELSNQVQERQQVYDEKNRHHTELANNLKQRQTEKECLDSNVQDMNNRWTSKRIWATTAATHAAELTQEK